MVVRDRDHRDVRRDVRRDNFRRDNFRRDNFRTNNRYNNVRHNNVRRDRVVVQRRPVYANNGRFVFNGGITRSYSRPIIRHRYYNYRVRPQIVVENYDPVPGYIWVAGHWNWTGYEWSWTGGYFAVDTSYAEPSYYDDDGYYDGY